MTKEELIRQAAKCLPSRVTTVKEEKAFIEGFVRGAEWMQAMMQGSNEGQALLYAVEKTAERTKREVIKKAVEWLKEEMHYKDHSSGRGSWGEIQALGAYNSLEEFIEDFKQAMQDERDL